MLPGTVHRCLEKADLERQFPPETLDGNQRGEVRERHRTPAAQPGTPHPAIFPGNRV